jgi:hypothetical protein
VIERRAGCVAVACIVVGLSAKASDQFRAFRLPNNIGHKHSQCHKTVKSTSLCPSSTYIPPLCLALNTLRTERLGFSCIFMSMRHLSRPRAPKPGGELARPSIAAQGYGHTVFTGLRKKRPISDCYAAPVERELPEKDRIKHRLPEGATYGDALAIVMFKAALDGKPDAVREIREAIEGRTGHRQETSESQEAADVALVEILNAGRARVAAMGASDSPGSAPLRDSRWSPAGEVPSSS